MTLPNGAINVSYQVTSYSALATSNQAMKTGHKRRHRSGNSARHRRRQSREINKTPELLDNAIFEDVNTTSEIDEKKMFHYKMNMAVLLIQNTLICRSYR